MFSQWTISDQQEYMRFRQTPIKSMAQWTMVLAIPIITAGIAVSGMPIIFVYIILAGGCIEALQNQTEGIYKSNVIFTYIVKELSLILIDKKKKSITFCEIEERIEK